MQYRSDGSPISSNSVALKKGGKSGLSTFEIERLTHLLGKANEFHLATIREIRYTDDLLNQSGNKVEYRIRCEFGPRHGQEYDSVTVLNLFGGVVNFSETILSPKKNVVKGNRNAEDQYMFTHDGTQVVITFMDGEKNKPFIVGSWPNTNLSASLAAKRSDGIRHIQEFNGLRVEINDNGEFILTYNGGKRDTKSLQTARASTSPTTIKIDKLGRISITDNEGQLIQLDRVAKSVNITSKENLKIVVGKDRNETISGNETKNISGDKTDTIGGNDTTTTSGDRAETISGSETITVTGDRTHSAANHTLTGGGDIKVGSAGSSENLVLGIAFQTLYNAHTHIGNLGVPTGPPIISMSANELAQKNFTE